MSLVLRHHGHDVRIARDGTQAIAAAQAAPPDVVLLDIGLPGMNGYDLARQLQVGSAGRTPLLVAVTGYGQEKDRLRSAEAGIHLHLVKPVDPKELEAALRSWQVSTQHAAV
jgi:two-component system, OmpR family, response regulator